MTPLEIIAGRTPVEQAAFWDAYIKAILWSWAGGLCKIIMVALAFWTLCSGGAQ